MSLPDLIEIVPLEKPVLADITIPGSKSITNRALALAALAGGETTLKGALWSEDTQVMVECLQDLGLMINVAPDPDEPCNRTITVYGQAGHVPRGGTEAQPLDLFVGNAGTAARFLAAMVCLGDGVYRLHGVARMHERPQAALFTALRALGYRVDSPNDKLPALVHGGGPKPGATCRVSIEESSQFASALLLAASAGKWSVGLLGENAEESSYVVMTQELIRAFPRDGGQFLIEPDASSGSYFWAASRLAHCLHHNAAERPHPAIHAWPVTIRHWPDSGWQIDARFKDVLPLQGALSRAQDLGDSIMTAITVAALPEWTASPREGGIRFTDLGRLRVQECERVAALRTELTRCGGKVVEAGDTLEVFPSALHGATVETYDDHRMAMCFAVLGLKVPGIRIKNPACVKKTFPNFFQKLQAAPPHGLGVRILDTTVSPPRPLGQEELFAD